MPVCCYGNEILFAQKNMKRPNIDVWLFTPKLLYVYILILIKVELTGFPVIYLNVILFVYLQL